MVAQSAQISLMLVRETFGRAHSETLLSIIFVDRACRECIEFVGADAATNAGYTAKI
jgi:hypothetical protein